MSTCCQITPYYSAFLEQNSLTALSTLPPTALRLSLNVFQCVFYAQTTLILLTCTSTLPVSQSTPSSACGHLIWVCTLSWIHSSTLQWNVICHLGWENPETLPHSFKIYPGFDYSLHSTAPAAAAAKSLQSYLTLCDSIDGSLPGPSVPGILQARILEWVAVSFSNACMHAKLLQSCLTLCDPMDSSPVGSSIHRILQARILEWVAISFSTPLHCWHPARAIITSLLDFCDDLLKGSYHPSTLQSVFNVSLSNSS